MCDICDEVSAGEGLCPPTMSKKGIGGPEEASSPACIHKEAYPHPSKSRDHITDGDLDRKQRRRKQYDLEDGPT